MPTLNLAPASTADYRRIAERRLPRFLFDYIDGGSYKEETLKRNVDDFEAILLKQRVLSDVSKIDTGTALFGRPSAMPIALAPIGMGGMMAPRAETLAVQAADDANVPFCLSTVSICSLEEVAAVATKPFWFQLYMMKDRGAVREILARAKAAGCDTLVFTVDLAVVGARYRDIRNGFGGGLGPLARVRAALSYALHPDWALNVGLKGRPLTFGNLSEYVPNATTPADFKAWVDSQFDASVTWRDIEWLREQWDGRLVIKGVLATEDAKAAADVGADGVIVSNHGGRQLDGVASSISILPRIADALSGRARIMMDGGVRSGQDALKAVALGADGALIGRPWVFAAAARGRAGVAHLLELLGSELRTAMALTGTTSLADASPELFDRAGNEPLT